MVFRSTIWHEYNFKTCISSVGNWRMGILFNAFTQDGLAYSFCNRFVVSSLVFRSYLIRLWRFFGLLYVYYISLSTLGNTVEKYLSSCIGM